MSVKNALTYLAILTKKKVYDIDTYCQDCKIMQLRLIQWTNKLVFAS
jgi:hypothetical protein